MWRQIWPDKSKLFFENLSVPHDKGWYNTQLSLKITMENEIKKWKNLVEIMKTSIEELGLHLSLKNYAAGRVLMLMIIFKSRYFYDLLDTSKIKVPLQCGGNCCDWENDVKQISIHHDLQAIKYPELLTIFFSAYNHLKENLEVDPETFFTPKVMIPDVFADDVKQIESEAEDGKHVDRPKTISIHDAYEKLNNKPKTLATEIDVNKTKFFDAIFNYFVPLFHEPWRNFLLGDIQFLQNALMTLQITLRCREYFVEQRSKKTFMLARELNIELISDSMQLVDEDFVFEIVQYPVSFTSQRNDQLLIYCKIVFEKKEYSTTLSAEVVFCLFGHEKKHQKKLYAILEEHEKCYKEKI